MLFNFTFNRAKFNIETALSNLGAKFDKKTESSLSDESSKQSAKNIKLSQYSSIYWSNVVNCDIKSKFAWENIQASINTSNNSKTKKDRIYWWM
ncbi:hypothetical protein NIES4071_43750 [Calothrix sp. NIES-4071]|nr:hypothetical protein NIES4071_43750 [Calothrix sp. NIES-4071]BAZ58689.1 hypothetical protein NIES4105_43680 [Calothrix sp. NIES-4105]